jgi:hypothetical protein
MLGTQNYTHPLHYVTDRLSGISDVHLRRRWSYASIDQIGRQIMRPRTKSRKCTVRLGKVLSAYVGGTSVALPVPNRIIGGHDGTESVWSSQILVRHIQSYIDEVSHYGNERIHGRLYARPSIAIGSPNQPLTKVGGKQLSGKDVLCSINYISSAKRALS